MKAQELIPKSILFPRDIRQHWQEIVPGLQEICQQGDGLIPEDYYALVACGQASLFMGDANEGFVVLQSVSMQDGPGDAPYKILRIMAVWCKSGDARKRYLVELDRIAASEGCRFLEFDTTRRGFLKDPEWFLDKMVFRREVSRGQKQ